MLWWNSKLENLFYAKKRSYVMHIQIVIAWENGQMCLCVCATNWTYSNRTFWVNYNCRGQNVAKIRRKSEMSQFDNRMPCYWQCNYKHTHTQPLYTVLSNYIMTIYDLIAIMVIMMRMNNNISEVWPPVFWFVEQSLRKCKSEKNANSCCKMILWPFFLYIEKSEHTLLLTCSLLGAVVTPFPFHPLYGSRALSLHEQQ